MMLFWLAWHEKKEHYKNEYVEIQWFVEPDLLILEQGAVIDFQGAARAIVRDWKAGRLGYYTLPEKLTQTEPIPSSILPNLQAVFEKNDERILSQVQNRKELRRSNHALVQLSGGEVESRTIDFEATVLLEDDDESMDEDVSEENEAEEQSDEELDTEGSDEESIEEGEESDEGTVSTPSVAETSDEDSVIITSKQKLSGKEGRKAKREEKAQPAPPKKKSVSFAPYTKAGAKTRVASTKTSGNVPNQKHTTAMAKGQKGKSLSNTASAAMENDAYDFSRYF
jgi:nuclear GTP-binding protein